MKFADQQTYHWWCVCDTHHHGLWMWAEDEQPYQHYLHPKVVEHNFDFTPLWWVWAELWGRA